MSREERPLPLLAGLIGWPVAQSKSQLIHEFWLRRLGIDGHYIRLPVRPGEVARAFRGMVALGFAGVQATMPHKRACYDLVDHHTPAARALGAVNTVIVEDDGSLTGENTDLPGFIEPLAGLDLTGEQVTVLGAGGAAAAVIAGLVSLGARRLAVVNRTAEGTARLLDDLADTVAGCEVIAADWGDAQKLANESRLIANATSLGMAGMPPLPLAVDSLREDAIVYDIVTHPHDTPLLRAAAARGLRTHDGLEMLVGQAREAFRRFYGAEAPKDADADLRSLLLA
ncbi:shikimate dehydrogenase [Novosphingobium sp.]|jgi:shikimate dehydrogenase|uniref:shikimate dehydrogenase family protein n=1 Tax=Novosphingobium sp. TaxID=1874826 RepID=UPI001EB224F7|nr:shikimate dehydrogenase [Novosphingobium sp.]MBK6802902.1 shikimate dehydrogenase [Novosphingobium sp.]MBK9012250.1 shikimate dehydrogenase [Novosphingobium sp.]